MFMNNPPEWFFDDVRFEIPFYHQKIITETLRLFYERLDCTSHMHPSFELHIITEGRVLYTFADNSNIILEKNDLLFIMPGNRHSERLLTPSHGIAFGFYFKPQNASSAFLPEIQKEADTILQTLQSYDKSYYLDHDCNHIIEIFSEIYNELKARKTGCLITTQNLLIQVITELSRGMSQEYSSAVLPKKSIQDDMTYIASNYFKLFNRPNGCDHSLKELASLLCLSERQTSRYLLKTFNKTFLELLNDAKVSTAKHLLSQTTKSIDEIASVCGWTNKYFHHRFKQATGTTPMKYRKSHAKAPQPTANTENTEEQAKPDTEIIS